MARSSNGGRSGVSYGPSPDNFQSGIRVPQASGVDQKAADLQRALGILAPAAQTVFNKVEDANALQGAADAQVNNIDQAKMKRSQAYEKAAVQTQTAAAFVQTEGEFRTWYDQNFDKTKGTPQELSQHLDEFLTERYGHVDKHQAEVLVPRMAAFRQQLIKEQQENLSTAVKNDQVAAVGTLIRDSVNKNQPINPDELKAQLLPMFSKGEAAENYMNLIGTIAVERGQPKLLDAMIPEKWEDGTPGPRSTPKLANQINQYRAFAEAAERQANADAKAHVAKATEAGQVKIAQLAANGDLAGAKKELDNLANLGGLDRSDYTALDNFITNKRDDAREQAYNPDAYIQWRVNLRENPSVYANAGYIMQNASRLFPPGPQRQAAVAGAMDDALTALNASRSIETKPKAKAYRDALDNQFKPDTLATSSDKQLYAEGMKAFDLTFVETQDPEKANEAAQQVFDKKRETDKSRKPSTVKDDVTALTSNQMDAGSFKTKYSGAGSVSKLRDALNNGEITREQAAVAVKALQ